MITDACMHAGTLSFSLSLWEPKKMLLLASTHIKICTLFYLILKSYTKYKIDRDIADNADKKRKKSKKHTGHM